jgi:hypothetical protein
MIDTTGWKLTGCKEHGDRSDLLCCKIRDANLSPVSNETVMQAIREAESLKAYVLHNNKTNRLFLGFGVDAVDAAERVLAKYPDGTIDDFGVGGSVAISDGCMDLDKLWPYFAMAPRCESRNPIDVIQGRKQ